MADPRHLRYLPRHGGDLAFATAVYGAPAGGWLDLSTGINPVPYPVPPADPADAARLPAGDALAALISAARSAYGVPDQVGLVAVPGTDIALRLLPLVAPPGPVAIVSPTYGGHAEAWRNAGRSVTAIPDLAQAAPDAAIVVVVNPNNPDGRLTRLDDLRAVAARLATRGGLLVVDEAFADVAPDISLATALGEVTAIVLRSFGKFYGLPGLRLGFVAGPPLPTGRLAALLGDWPVSAAAISAGRAALVDSAWRSTTRARLAADAARLKSVLADHGLTHAGGTSLFALVEHPRAAALHVALAERGVWTRAFAERPEWLRIGLPGDESGFAWLQRALSAAVASVR